MNYVEGAVVDWIRKILSSILVRVFALPEICCSRLVEEIIS